MKRSQSGARSASATKDSHAPVFGNVTREIDRRRPDRTVQSVFRQTIEAVETLDVLTPDQRDLVVEADDGELAVYRLLIDLDGSVEMSLIVAPRDPRLQPGMDVAADGQSGVRWSTGPGEEEVAEIHVSSRLVPFDWDAYWTAARD